MKQLVIRGLIDTHRNMERVLMLMRFQLDSLRHGKNGSACTLLANAISYMHRYPGMVHHPVEEMMFAALVARSPDSKVVCSRLTEQHKLFMRWELELQRHIRAVQDGDAEASRKLVEVGIPYCLEHASHIHSEETEVFPRAQKHLKPEDWREIDGHSKVMSDPLFGGDELKRFGSLYDYLMSARQDTDIH